MRKYLSYLFSTLAALTLAGCVEVGIGDIDVPASAKLQIRSTELVATRTAGVQDLNENLISQVQLFFTADGENVLYSTKVEVAEEDGIDGIIEDLPLTIPSGAMDLLFAGSDTCKLFVVANAPDITGENLTVEDVNESVINLAKQNTVQPSFVMTGLSKNIIKTKNSVEGSVNLKRVAAKIEVTLNIDKTIVVGEGALEATWESLVKDENNQSLVSMSFSGMTSSTVDGTVSSDPYPFVQSDFNFTENTEEWQLKQTLPFYSYPTTWTHETENIITLSVPWKLDGASEYQTYQYQIPVNYDDMELVSNNLYKLTVNIGILGGLQGDVLVTPCSYVVIDWGSGTINTELSRPKYLVVDENNAVMNNVNSYSIGYASSDAVTAVITSVTKPDYTSETSETISIYSGDGSATVTPSDNVSGNKSPFTVSVNSTNNTITLSHTLVNDNTSTSFDYVAYDITLKVTNESGFTETITIRQYPAVYVLNHLNNNGVKESRETMSDKDGHNGAGYGYVMVNTLYANSYKYSQYNQNQNEWQTVESFDNSSYNPNMYIITTTSLDASLANKYVLGDSREVNTYTAQQVGFTSVTDVMSRTLESYRPTKTDRDDYLSPQFRISSAYGQLGSHTLSANEAKYRCAAYQEDGYPAGRWRLATYAELSYIAMLCAKGGLPESLFGASDYWSATGSLTIDTSEGTVSKSNESSAFLRCVYDDWYWGNEQLKDKTKYVWGDKSTTAQINATL